MDDYHPEPVPLSAYDDDDIWRAVQERVAADAERLTQDEWDRRQRDGAWSDTEPATSMLDRLLTVDAVLQLEPPDPLIGDWLDVGMLAEMPGRYGSLKSFAAMSMCLSVATGRPWLGEAIHRTGPALYCSLEGAYTLGPRYAGWLAANGLGAADAAQCHTWGGRLNILDDAQVAEFAGLLAELRPVLTVIDTLSKATPGAEENGSEFGSKVYEAMAHFRDCSGGSVLAVHHSGHSATGRGRGHSSLEDDIDVVISFEGQWKEGPVRMVSQKQKARENPPPKWIGLESLDVGPVLVRAAEGPEPEGPDWKAAVLAMVTKHPGQLTKSDLCDKNSRGYVGHQKAVYDAVKKLDGEGRLRFEKVMRDGDRRAVDVLCSVIIIPRES
jgi:hypothetical protein